LVELHGGIVTVTSGGLGEGSTFVVNLPIQSVEHGSGDGSSLVRGATRESHPAVSLKSIKTLVVDDDADARSLLQLILENHEATVFMAESTEEALKIFSRERPDVVVSDIGMPSRDGYELIRSIRALSGEDGGDTPAIALTALARAEDRKRAMLAGFQSHISKPVDADELIAMVATLTGRTGR
jgi:CheY-like chemotaxis protein